MDEPRSSTSERRDISEINVDEISDFGFDDIDIIADDANSFKIGLPEACISREVGQSSHDGSDL